MIFQQWRPAAVLGAALIAVAATPHETQAQSGGQSVLKTNMVEGFVTLYVNGQKIGRVGKADMLSGDGIKDFPLSRYVKPGANTLRIVWQGTKAPTGSVTVGYAAPGGKMRELTSLDLSPVSVKASGSRTLTFNVPRSGTNQSTQADTSASGTVAPGSHPNQTLMQSNIVNGATGTVFVNGKKVGSYSSGLVPLDISDYVKFGENTLRLTWADEAPTGSVRVSYAVQPSKFRTITEINMNPLNTKASTKSRTLSFMLPKPR